MKRLSSYLIVVLTASPFLTGCSSREGDDTAKKAAETTAVPVVYVSNYPLQYFVERIASPLVEVRFPAGRSADPAYWNPTAEEIAEMQRADLIVLNGASYEQWLKTVSLPQSRMVTSTGGLEDRLIALKEKITHSHGLEGEHEHSGTAFTTWLDLTLAIEQARVVTEALAACLPEHQVQFQDRFLKLEEDLRTLDEEIAAVISKAADRPVIFSHPVYQYFQQRYKVNGKNLHWEPDQAPDDKMWKELQHLRETHPAAWMIWEDTPLPETVTRLEAIGVKSVIFHPCGNVPGEGDFITVMEQNIAALKQVYQGG